MFLSHFIPIISIWAVIVIVLEIVERIGAQDLEEDLRADAVKGTRKLQKYVSVVTAIIVIIVFAFVTLPSLLQTQDVELKPQERIEMTIIDPAERPNRIKEKSNELELDAVKDNDQAMLNASKIFNVTG